MAKLIHFDKICDTICWKQIGKNFHAGLVSFHLYRSVGYPDQFDRASQCIMNSTHVDPACGVSFPETLAFAEHESNVTFYQVLAAAAKNLQDFCHVCKLFQY